MEKIVEWIGGIVVPNLWFNDAIDEVLVESLFIYAILQVCCMVGLLGIFAKLNSKSAWALIPAVNVARLGYLCDSLLPGAVIALCKIGFLIVAEATVRVYLIPIVMDDALNWHCTITVLLAIVLFVVRTVAGCFLYRQLIYRFSESRWWLIAFLLFPNVTTLLFGFNPQIRS